MMPLVSHSQMRTAAESRTEFADFLLHLGCWRECESCRQRGME